MLTRRKIYLRLTDAAYPCYWDGERRGSQWLLPNRLRKMSMETD